MDYKDNLLGVVQTLFRWRKPIAVICGLAAIGSIVISLMMPVYYKATTTFLAGSPDQSIPELLFGIGSREAGYYGNDNDVSRLLMVAESDDLIDFLVDSFNLYQHYGIDPGHPKSSFLVERVFSDFFDVKKNKLGAIELSVEDQDPQLAAFIANAACDRIDEVAQQLIKKSQAKILTSFEESINAKEQLLRTINDSLIRVRNQFGIFNSVAQSETLTELMSTTEAELARNKKRLEVMEKLSYNRDTITRIRAMVAGMQDEIDTIRNKINLFNVGMPAVLMLEKQFYEANEQLSLDKERYKHLANTYRSDSPAIIMVERARTPVIKSRPKRSIMVAATTLVAFIFSVIGVLLWDNYKNIKWREIFYAR